MFVPYNTKQIKAAYVSKYNNKRDIRVNLLMITNNNDWHYLAVKSISGLLTGITSKHNEDLYCLNCFHSYTTEKKQLKRHERICKDHDFCYVKMPNEDNKISKYNPGEKSLRVPRMPTSKNRFMP